MVGVVAGFANVIAGGGSLLTMPAMIFMGMSPATANGTNRIALLAQNITAVGEFRRRGMADFRLSLTLGLCTLPGAVLGAVAAVRIDPLWFKRLLALVMIGVLVVTLRNRKPGAGEGATHPGWAHLGMVGVGFYGGFIQAGVGFIFMALVRGLLHLDLVRTNMHKVFVIGMYMVPSLLVFAATGQVCWLAGGVLAIGTSVGGWLGTRLQISRGEGVVRVVFAVAVVAMAVKLLIG
ncbi:MAG TPA: sulfite exporter TauE/SafE family protein [Methylomirabilota bacterium]|nr:sulfite exporter TauE/SafE family protein [Methylomirabilota bacterium]